jgi:hypothetical protein
VARILTSVKNCGGGKKSRKRGWFLKSKIHQFSVAFEPTLHKYSGSLLDILISTNLPNWQHSSN